MDKTYSNGNNEKGIKFFFYTSLFKIPLHKSLLFRYAKSWPAYKNNHYVFRRYNNQIKKVRKEVGLK